jgi:hypothetical protein
MATRPVTKDFVLPFLVGLAAAPFVKPLIRGTVKTAVGVSMRMRVLAAEASQELQGMAAQATADVAASSRPSGS